MGDGSGLIVMCVLFALAALVALLVVFSEDIENDRGEHREKAQKDISEEHD